MFCYFINNDGKKLKLNYNLLYLLIYSKHIDEQQYSK